MIDLNGAAYRPLNSAVRQMVYADSGKGVHTVMVDGKVVVEDGNLATMSEAALHAEAESARVRSKVDAHRLRHKNNRLLPDILAAHERANQVPLEFDRLLVRRQT